MTVLTMLGIVAAIAAIIVVPLEVVGLVQGRRKKLAIQYGAYEDSLDMPLSHERLKMTWDGAELRDPRYVVVRVSNVGSADLTSAMFDRSRPIQVTISGCEIVGAMSDSSDWNVDATAKTLTYGPDLLRSRTAREISLLVNGRPQFEWELPVTDVKTSWVVGLPPTTANMEEERRPRARVIRGAQWFFAALIVLWLLGFVSTFLLGN